MTAAKFGYALMASLALLLASYAAAAAPQNPTDAVAALLDRAQIEEPGRALTGIGQVPHVAQQSEDRRPWR